MGVFAFFCEDLFLDPLGLPRLLPSGIPLMMARQWTSVEISSSIIPRSFLESLM